MSEINIFYVLKKEKITHTNKAKHANSGTHTDTYPHAHTNTGT